MLVSKQSLAEYLDLARGHFPSLDLKIRHVDNVMYVLQSAALEEDITPVVSRNELYQILYSLCNIQYLENVHKIRDWQMRKGREETREMQEELDSF